MRVEQVRRLVILTTPRTGSTWLVDQMHRPPFVTFYSELFLSGTGKQYPSVAGAKDVPMWEWHCRQRGRSGLRSQTLLRRYLLQVFENADGANAVGLKLMYRLMR